MARTKITADIVLRLSNFADERATSVREARHTSALWGTARYVPDWKMGRKHDPGNQSSVQIRQAIREGKNTIALIGAHIRLPSEEVGDLVREMSKMGILE